MRSNRQDRVIVASVGAVLSALAVFISAGLTGWGFHVAKYGMRPPEMFGWTGSFILFGLIALAAVAPALLAILGCGCAWRTRLGRHALFSSTLALVLGCAAIVLFIVASPQDTTLWGVAIAGTACLGITVVAEAAFRRRLQNNDVHGTAYRGP